MSPVCYFAYFDILGFTNFIEHNTDENIYKLFKSYIDIVVNKITNEGMICDLPINLHLNHIISFDTIIIWSHGNSHEDLRVLLNASVNIMGSTFLFGFPLKGNINHGIIIDDINKYDYEKELDIFNKNDHNNNKYKNYSIILTGKSLLESYKQCNKQNWSGCTITNNVIDMINVNDYSQIIKYNNIPIKIDKKTDIEKGYVLDWISRYALKGNNLFFKDIEYYFIKHNKENIDKDKIKNTKEFYEYIINKNSHDLE